MSSHVTVGIAGLDRALGFRRPLMLALGWRRTFIDRNPPGPWAGRTPAGSDGWPQVATTFPCARDLPAAPGNGPMLAVRVGARAKVDDVHALARTLGGADEGDPGVRPHDHADDCGACFRDPDGNKVGVGCHAPDPAPEPSA